MKLETIKWIAIIILLILLLFTCKRNVNTNNKVDERKIENKIIEKTIIRYKDSIIYRDSIIIKYVSIKDSISKMNKNILESFYNAQTETETMNRTECDTIIQGLVTEIEISDTIIYNQNKTIAHRDNVITSLEIMNHNFETMLNEVEKELVKTDKKIKRNKIWALIMTGVAAITTTILIVK